jgi:hypothetical protein
MCTSSFESKEKTAANYKPILAFLFASPALATLAGIHTPTPPNRKRAAEALGIAVPELASVK